jgi:RNA polymerase-binding transcription factor DksA
MTTPTTTSRAGTDRSRPATLATLHAELAALQAQMADHQATIEELTGQQDVDSMLEREMAETGSLRGSEAIADIEHALRRMDDGTYGTCERCRGAIAAERLAAIPHARHCVACTGQPPRLLG